MPFYRCMPPAGSGGGGGGGDFPISQDDFITFYDDNNNKIYPNVMQLTMVFRNGNSVDDYHAQVTNTYLTNIPNNYTIKYGGKINSAPYGMWGKGFNGPVIIENGLLSAGQMFGNSKYFNYPVTFPNSCTNYYMTFYNSNVFNSKVTFPSVLPKAASASRMFSYANNFNQPLVFPANIVNLSGLLEFPATAGATFNQPIVIKCGSLNIWSMFMNAFNMGSNIIFTGDTSNFYTGYAKQVFYNKPAAKRINIYANNLTFFASANFKPIDASTSLSWTATTNGYYNAAHNLYLYSNVSDAKNWFSNYWYNMYGEYPDLDP